MTSIHLLANSMLDEYRQAMNLEESDLPMNATFERWLVDASNLGLTPEHVRICIRERLAFNRRSPCKKGIELKHLVRDEDDVAVVLNEVAVYRASKRIKVMPPNRASILRSTGRSDAVPTPDAVPVADVALIQQLRKAAQ